MLKIKNYLVLLLLFCQFYNNYLLLILHNKILVRKWIYDKKITIDEYIDIGKNYIFVYIIITIILFLILLYIGDKNNFYYILIFVLIMIIMIIKRIDTYYTLRELKSYLAKKNILDKIDNIDYWNKRYYF